MNYNHALSWMNENPARNKNEGPSFKNLFLSKFKKINDTILGNHENYKENIVNRSHRLKE